jgi:ribosome-associated translation inhibitor RaiA
MELSNDAKNYIEDKLDQLHQLNKDMLEVQSGILRFGESPGHIFVWERLENQKKFFNELVDKIKNKLKQNGR